MKNLPDRDTTKPAEQQGMFRKFEVRRVDGSDEPGGKHHGCRYFVLDLDHDPHAAAAMAAYGQACKETHPALSAEISAEYPAPKPVAVRELVRRLRAAEAKSQEAINALRRIKDNGKNLEDHEVLEHLQDIARTALRSLDRIQPPKGEE